MKIETNYTCNLLILRIRECSASLPGWFTAGWFNLENALWRLDFKPSSGFRVAVFLRAVWVLVGFIGSALAGASGSIRWLSRPAWTFSESFWALLAALWSAYNANLGAFGSVLEALECLRKIRHGVLRRHWGSWAYSVLRFWVRNFLY